jgi:hypothetical protein
MNDYRQNLPVALSSIIKAAIQFGGHPLEPGIRESLESRFGCSLADVRIHRHRLAGKCTRLLGTDAYTLGRNIVFSPGAYDPCGDVGIFLLAHEIAHCVQQRAWAEQADSYVLGDADSRFESEAQKAAQMVARGFSTGVLTKDPSSGVLRCFPCPGSPDYNIIDAFPKEIYEPANEAIEKAYREAKRLHGDAIFFGSQFETGRDVLLPRGARNKAFGNELLRRLRGLQAQLRPDIIDFEERVFYEIKTAKTANISPEKVRAQLLHYYSTAEAIRKAYGVALEREWTNFNATWKPPHQLPLGGDVLKKFVCTAATDYTRWPSGLILYDVRELSEEEQKRKEVLRDLENQFQLLSNAYAHYRGEHKAQLDLYNNNFAGFWTNRLFNKVPPEMLIWNNAHARLLAVRRLIQERNAPKAAAELMLARMWYLYALKKYISWKDGIENAGRNMQILIVAVAAILIVAAAAATFATAAAGAGAGASAAAGTSTEVTLFRIAALCQNADKAIAAAEAEMELLAAIEEAAKLAATIP